MSTNHARSWQQLKPQELPKTKEQVHVKVHSKRWITKGEKVIYTFICLLFIAAGYFVVSYSSSMDTLNRKMQSLESTVQNQQILNEGLSYEMRELSRPERIITIAKENGLEIQDTKMKQAKELTTR